MINDQIVQAVIEKAHTPPDREIQIQFAVENRAIVQLVVFWISSAGRISRST
jgi:hypothetical protein